MRMLVFFDLPVVTGEDRRNYRNFRKLLITHGFIMLQESVYCKMITTPTVEKSVMDLLRNNKPPEGIVQALMITEKQFSKMEYIVGKFESDVVSNTDRVVVL